MVELCLAWRDNLPPQSDKIGYVLLNKSVYPTYYWPDFGGRHVVWQTMWTEDPYGYQATDPDSTNWFCDLRVVKWRFDLAAQYKDRAWTHGVFLLREELWTPASAVKTDLRKWKYIDGSESFYGIQVDGLKNWYIKKYGSWNQAWWDNVKNNNLKNDTVLRAWSHEYASKLYQAWHLHMKAIGKKSAIIGIMTADARYPVTQVLDWIYGVGNWRYIVDNYDFILYSLFITCVSGCERSVAQSARIAQEMRAFVKGSMCWFLTALWMDGAGSADKTIQFEEYKVVLPYVNIIGLPAYSNMRTSPYSEPSEPRLLEFCAATNSCPGTVPPPPPPPPEPELVPVMIRQEGEGSCEFQNMTQGTTDTFLYDRQFTIVRNDVIRVTPLPAEGWRLKHIRWSDSVEVVSTGPWEGPVGLPIDWTIVYEEIPPPPYSGDPRLRAIGMIAALALGFGLLRTVIKR